MIKYRFLIIALLSIPFPMFAQEQESEAITVANDTWGREFFKFPLRFASNIDFQGMEEALFPKSWGNIESHELWSYAFAWKIQADKPLSETDMETNLQYYFDGLLTISLDRTDFTDLQKTNAIFVQKETSSEDLFYTGKIKTYDTRITKKPMTLHVRAEQHYCEQAKETIILFKFSPKGFDHKIWSQLAEVTLRHDICDE
ncbi:MAG: hypothetical protein Roseis2KO_10310 [Roseivirga sp.]